jgi:phage tail tape measure protein, TP901 family, core region|nr:MAG TPA: tail tape measure protein [Caudoviricetes sp.]
MKNDFSIQLSANDQNLIKALNNSQNKLAKLESSFQKASSKSKVFGSATESLGNQLQGLSGKFEGLLQSVGGSMEGLTGMFGGSVSEMLGSLGVLSGGFAALGAAAIGACAYILKGFDDLKSEMNNFQAVTDVSDEEMKAFEQSARDLSNSTGVAEKSIIALQTSLVGINPQLAQNREALLKSTEAAILLGKAGRISSEEASTALSSILAQYNLAGTESVNVANAIAAGSKAGAIEIEGLGEVLQKAGTTMHSAGLDYAQSVALVEAVGDKWLNKESELGTHLQSTFSKLQSVKKGWEQFNPAIVGTTQALENMSRAQLKYSDLVELVGLQNAPLLQQLIDARGKYAELQKEVTGTTAAQDMAAKQTDTLSNSWQRVTNTWDNLMTSIANSQPMQELYSYIQYVCDSISELISWAGGLIDQWNQLMSGFDSSFTVWDLLKGYIQYNMALIKALGEAFIVTCALIVKPLVDLWNLIKRFAADVWKRLSDFPLGRAVQNAVKEALKWLQDLWKKIVSWYNNLKKYLGLKTDNSTDVKLNVKEDRTVTQTFKGGGSGLPSLSSSKKGGKKGGSKKHGSGSKKTGIEEPEIGSLKYFEDKLRQINKELSDTNVSSGRLQELKMEAAVLEEQISKIKRRNKLFDEKPKHDTQKATVEQGSIQEISDLISSKENQLKNLKVGSDGFNLLVQEIEELKEKKDFLELKMHPKIDENSMNSLLGSLAKVQEKINGLKYEVSITTDKSKLELLREQIDYLTNKEHKIQLSIDEKRQNTIAQNADDIKTKYEGLGQAAQSVGNVFTALGNVASDSFLGMVGNIAGAVSSILPEIGKLVAANQVAALSSGTASAAALPFPANLVSIATIVSTILGLFASFPKFADGGIIQGKSFGDYNLARVNGGEMILNTTQQGRLWNTIQQGTTSSSAPISGAVKFHIEGKQLVGVLNNYNSSKSRL